MAGKVTLLAWKFILPPQARNWLHKTCPSLIINGIKINTWSVFSRVVIGSSPSCYTDTAHDANVTNSCCLPLIQGPLSLTVQKLFAFLSVYKGSSNKQNGRREKSVSHGTRSNNIQGLKKRRCLENQPGDKVKTGAEDFPQSTDCTV